MTVPIVTIIIPTYNREIFIPETLNCLKDQTYKNWECLIIDDGSEEITINIIEEFSKTDTRFRLIKKTNQNKGAPASRNIGLKQALGKYIIFLDSDDLLAETCLENRITFMEFDKNIDIGVFNGLIFSTKKHDKNTIISTYRGRDALSQFLTLDVPWVIHNSIWKREFLSKNAITWDENISFFQDLQFNVKALSFRPSYKYCAHDPDCFWRMHDKGNIGQELHKPDSFKNYINLVKSIINCTQISNPTTGEKRNLIKLITHIFYKLYFKNQENAKIYLNEIESTIPYKFKALKLFFLLYEFSPLNRVYFYKGFIFYLFRVKKQLYIKYHYFLLKQYARI